MAIRYSIRLPGGSQPPATYPSRAAAAAALRASMGWPRVLLSHPWCADAERDDDRVRVLRRTGWSAYPSVREREADRDGAHAPAIVREDGGAS